MDKRRILSMALFGLLFLVAPTLAHHSFSAEYDSSKLIAVKGILTKVAWENPHGWFYVTVKDESGNVTDWAFETVSPNPIHHQYPNARTEFFSNVGKVITVVGCPAKDVPHKGSAMAVKLADGKVMKVGLPGAYQGTQKEDELLQSLK